mgnify:CR=1 FL=1
MTEQQVLALIAGEMRRLGLELNRVKQENEGCQGPTIGTTVIKTFPIPAAPPPAAESEEVVERVKAAIIEAYCRPNAYGSDGDRDWRNAAIAAIAAVKGGGGE